ncbi:MAG: isochorismatase family protein [Candidatus Falkowbacteria bacterium]
MERSNRVIIPGLGTILRLKIASMHVDAENGFAPLCPLELPVPDGQNIVHELIAQNNFARYLVGSKEGHSDHPQWAATESEPAFTPMTGYPNMNRRWNVHCAIGTYGGQLLDGLPPISGYDFMVWKGIEDDMHPYGACYHDLAKKLSTGLIEWLTCQRISTVIVGGLATDYCVLETVLELLEAGFEVVVNLGACRGVATDTTDTAIKKMIKHGAIIIQSSQELTLV